MSDMNKVSGFALWQEWRERYGQRDEAPARNRGSISEMKETNYAETVNSNTNRRAFYTLPKLSFVCVLVC